jgi:hypothetical protein
MSMQLSKRSASRANAESTSKAGLGFGEGTVFESLLQPAPSVPIKLRPVPGSRVDLIPANTQGAGKSETASPPKAHETAVPRMQRKGLYIRRASASDCSNGGCKDA